MRIATADKHIATQSDRTSLCAPQWQYPLEGVLRLGVYFRMKNGTVVGSKKSKSFWNPFSEHEHYKRQCTILFLVKIASVHSLLGPNFL